MVCLQSVFSSAGGAGVGEVDDDDGGHCEDDGGDDKKGRPSWF